MISARALHRLGVRATLIAALLVGAWGAACSLNPQPIPPGISGEDAGVGDAAGGYETEDSAAPPNTGDEVDSGEEVPATDGAIDAPSDADAAGDADARPADAADGGG